MPLSKAVILAIGTVGILGVALVAPNSLQMLTLFGYGHHQTKKLPKSKIAHVLRRLERQKLVSIQKEGNEFMVVLTLEGEQALARYKARDRVQENAKWDGKWRIVIFDIKEKRRAVRDHLRQELREFGFLRLQNSVWVSPHECEDVISLLKTDVNIGRDLLYILAEHIEGEERLMRKFSLPRE